MKPATIYQHPHDMLSYSWRFHLSGAFIGDTLTYMPYQRLKTTISIVSCRLSLCMLWLTLSILIYTCKHIIQLSCEPLLFYMDSFHFDTSNTFKNNFMCMNFPNTYFTFYSLFLYHMSITHSIWTNDIAIHYCQHINIHIFRQQSHESHEGFTQP